jgi:glycosyltransferase involved in cell wall biosynthesis
MQARILSVSIVVPAFNEAGRLPHSLRAIGEYAARLPSTEFELIVVDDGSTDGTASAAERHRPTTANVRSRVLRYAANRGKGYAVRYGLLEARASLALFTDADLSTPLEEMPKLLEPLARGDADVTFGSRALNRRLIGVHQPRRREWAGRAFNVALRVATGLPFLDTQCGFKAFRLGVCRPLLEAGTIDGFGFDIELLFEAHRAGLRLREIPVRWNHCEGSKVRCLRDGIRMLSDIAAVRRRSATGEYDSGIRLAGAAAHRDRVHWSPSGAGTLTV